MYGHSWFVDPERQFTVIAFTNTALEGMSGQFPYSTEHDKLNDRQASVQGSPGLA